MELVNLPILNATLIVVAAIVLDAVLGVIKSFKPDTEPFEFKKLPQFIASGILPYVGGLIVLAVVAQFIGEPYTAIYYPLAAAVLAKYLVEIKDKFACLFNL